MQWSLMGFLILVLIVALFALHNQTSVSFDYFFGSLSVPLAILLIVSVIAGVVLGSLTSFGRQLELTRERRRLKEDLDECDSRIDELEDLVDEYERTLTGKPVSRQEEQQVQMPGQTSLLE